MQLTSQLYTFTRNRSFFLLYSHAMCTTSLKVITWPGQKGERISSRERSDGPKKFPNRLHKHQRRGPSLRQPAKANNSAELGTTLSG